MPTLKYKFFILSFFLFHLLVSSAFSQIAFKASSVIEGECSKIDLLLSNPSRSSISDIRIEAILLGQSIASFTLPVLRKSESKALSTTICEHDLKNPRHGTFPLVIRGSYSDQNLLIQDLLDVIELPIGESANAKSSPPSFSLTDFTASNDGSFKITNNSNQSIDGKIDIVSGSDFTFDVKSKEFSLKPGEGRQIFFLLKSSMPEMLEDFPIHVAVQYKSNGEWNSIIKKSIFHPKSKFFGLGTQLFQVLVLVVLIGISFACLYFAELRSAEKSKFSI